MLNTQHHAASDEASTCPLHFNERCAPLLKAGAAASANHPTPARHFLITPANSASASKVKAERVQTICTAVVRKARASKDFRLRCALLLH